MSSLASLSQFGTYLIINTILSFYEPIQIVRIVHTMLWLERRFGHRQYPTGPGIPGNAVPDLGAIAMPTGLSKGNSRLILS
jgi:hypothetical protein